MKIICVGYFHGAGGAEKQIIKLANELSMRGQIVTVIALSECKIQYEINRQVNLVNLSDEKVDGIFARLLTYIPNTIFTLKKDCLGLSVYLTTILLFSLYFYIVLMMSQESSGYAIPYIPYWK